MITRAMSNVDKLFEALRVYQIVYDFYKDKKIIFRDRLFKKTSSAFPYYNRFSFVDDKNNEWHVVFYCKNKEWRRKGVFYCYAYFIYEIPPTRKKNQTNFGKGLIFYNPKCIYEYWNSHFNGIPSEIKSIQALVFEVVPHAMNRYNERFLKPNGLDGIDFTKKVEMMLFDWINIDFAADLRGDESTKKNLREDVFPYDAALKNNGTLKGVIYKDFNLVQFYTYITKDMMFENQKVCYEDMVKKYYKSLNPDILRKRDLC